MELPNHVKRVLAALEAAGHEAWCVGGCVRDVLSGRKPEDWDIAASALPEETLAVFGSQALPTGLKHGTVTVKTEGGPVEVTTYRIDGAYQDHRRPESVTFTRSIDQDLARRDFTVNAMAWNPRGGDVYNAPRASGRPWSGWWSGTTRTSPGQTGPSAGRCGPWERRTCAA